MAGDFYLSTAYAVRRWVGVEEAQTLLLLAEEILRPQAIWHYNLACYLAVLGDFAGARERLKAAFAIEPKYRLTALDDEDLRALWVAL